MSDVCRKYKRRGTREELVQALQAAEHARLNAVGYLAGQSIMTKDVLRKTLVETIKKVQGV